MEAGAVLLSLVVLFGVGTTQDFYGDSISFMPLKKTQDGTIQVTFHNRENGRTNCPNQVNYTCDSGACTSFKEGLNLQTDRDKTGQNRWCQSEGRTTVTASTNKTFFSLSDSGCCWLSGTKAWSTHADLDLGTRSDTHSLNSCPVTTTVAALRVAQNCFSRLQLLAHDPDGDDVKCRFAGNSTANFILDETKCMLIKDGDISVGAHVFELMLEDFPTRNITLSYQDGISVFRDVSDANLKPLCRVKLQFSLEVLPPLANCKAGHIQPMFLSKTPSHGDVLHASVGHMFHLHAEAQAHSSSIRSFQVSGPQNMTKQFTDKGNGKAELKLSWTPQETDVYRFVPVCFTAETNEIQSEMRCVIVMVTRATIIQGKATVTCEPNKMTVVLDKASMPGIDENFLMLRDKSCSLTSNATHIMGSMSFSTCGTKLEDKGDFIAFQNEIDSFELPTEVIIRRKKVKIEFLCQFPKTISVSSYYNLHESDYIFTESSFGSFGYTFEIYQDKNFTNKVSLREYPVEVRLLEMVYMGIEASSDVPNVTVFVESCKATPDDNPDNSLSYDLIKDGCIRDETVKVHSSKPTEFNFEVQAFKFTGNYDQVYITCAVILCEQGNSFSRCSQGCVKSSSRRRRRRGLAKETVAHYITQGPLMFIKEEVPDEAFDEDDFVNKINDQTAVPTPPQFELPTGIFVDKKHWDILDVIASNASTAIFATAFVFSLLVMAVLIWYFTKKRRAEDQKSLLVSECED